MGPPPNPAKSRAGFISVVVFLEFVVEKTRFLAILPGPSFVAKIIVSIGCWAILVLNEQFLLKRTKSYNSSKTSNYHTIWHSPASAVAIKAQKVGAGITRGFLHM